MDGMNGSPVLDRNGISEMGMRTRDGKQLGNVKCAGFSTSEVLFLV